MEIDSSRWSLVAQRTGWSIKSTRLKTSFSKNKQVRMVAPPRCLLLRQARDSTILDWRAEGRRERDKSKRMAQSHFRSHGKHRVTNSWVPSVFHNHWLECQRSLRKWCSYIRSKYIPWRLGRTDYINGYQGIPILKHYQNFPIFMISNSLMQLTFILFPFYRDI